MKAAEGGRLDRDAGGGEAFVHEVGDGGLIVGVKLAARRRLSEASKAARSLLVLLSSPRLDDPERFRRQRPFSTSARISSRYFGAGVLLDAHAHEAFPAHQRAGDEFIGEKLRVALQVIVGELDDVERVGRGQPVVGERVGGGGDEAGVGAEDEGDPGLALAASRRRPVRAGRPASLAWEASGLSARGCRHGRRFDWRAGLLAASGDDHLGADRTGEQARQDVPAPPSGRQGRHRLRRRS